MADSGQQPLLTEKSFALALSPPRAPPVGTAHRTLLLASQKDPSTQPVAFHQHVLDTHHNSGGASLEHTGARLRKHLLRTHNQTNHKSHRRRLPHPHLSAGPELGDQVTRFLGVVLPVEWHNSWRDSGTFRSICDSLVTASAPMVGLTSPRAMQNFVRLSQRCRRHKYGPHKRQIIEMYLPLQQQQQEPLQNCRLVFFVHGGAWGSGLPWFYRLVAAPFVNRGVAVAILGYRTYPCGRVDEQVYDCLKGAEFLAQHYPDLTQNVTVMGHSSGAHIAMMMVIELAKQRMVQAQTATAKENDSKSHDGRGDDFYIKSLVGISGAYDISHHFDYEAARGVEELSPMKPVCGYTREAFRKNSPALRLQDALADDFDESKSPIDSWMPPRIVLVHGMEDETVPFTSTADAARVLRSCGVTCCQEIYIARTGHQETVMHIMLGGPTQDAVLQWMESSELEPREVDLIATSRL